MNIVGSKGGGKDGGGSAHVPTEADDTLKSKSFAKVLDLLCEGEIEGLALPGLRGVYLDGTPIENTNGSFNFVGVDFAFRDGTQHQEYIPAFPEVERERVVNVEVKKDTPIIQTVDDLSIDAVRVKVAVPRLSKQQSNGDIVGHKVSYKIETKSNGGSWSTRITDTMNGKSSGRYEREYAMTLKGDGPWQVRVKRTSDDDTKSSEQSETYFSTMTEVILVKLAYPNSVLAGLVVDSSQFSTIPTRTYLIKGMRIRVPSNYNPETREYSGLWDGTFKIAWSSNPAWVFYDVMIEDRYGLGDYISEINIDKWWLYQIAQYCDELVSDGFGGVEPRYEMHCDIRDARQALTMINELVSAFRAMPFWDGQQIALSQDSPQDPVKKFTNANVKDGKFSYQGSSRTARHTVALVEWENPENGYKSEIEYVEDADGLARYGYNPIQIAAFGCTSRSRANREGASVLFTNRLETDIISFTAGLSASGLRPGNIIEVSDSHRAGARLGGRILSSTALSFTLDAPVQLAEEVLYYISVELPEGGYIKRQINNVPGETDLITFPDPIVGDLPSDFAIWVITSASMDTSLWRVVTISEKDFEFSITALEHIPGKNAYIEEGVALESRSTTRSSKPIPPANVALKEQLFESAGRILNSIELTCDRHIEASEYQFSYSFAGSSWITLEPSGLSEQVVRDVQPGEYQIRARVRGPFGEWSLWTYLSTLVQGKTAPPGPVANLRGRVVSDQFRLSWDASEDLDVLVGGRVIIRHALSGSSWNAAADIGESVAGAATSASVPLLNGSYLVKFLDSSGKTSNEAALVTTNVAGVYSRNVVASAEHGPAFSGVSENLELTLAGDELVLEATSPGVNAVTASYQMDGPDLGSVYVSRIAFDMRLQIYKEGDLIDAREGLVDDWDDWDQTPDGSRVTYEFQYTTGNPADPNAIWTEWEKFFVGDYEARAARFRMLYESDDPGNVLKVSSARVVMDMPDQIDGQTGLICPAEGLDVVYQFPFYGDIGPPGITMVNPESGDKYQITNATKAGFNIRFFNVSGTASERIFNYLIKGY